MSRRRGSLGTRDDDLFGSIEELDAVPYVGQRAFELLDEYVRAQAPMPGAGTSVEGVELTEREARAIVDLALDHARTISIATDASWRAVGADDATTTPGTGWERPSFRDTSWPFAAAPGPTDCGAQWVPEQPWEVAASSIWSRDDRFAAFFRKTVDVPDGAELLRAPLTIAADDDVAVWVNGAQVYVEADFGVYDGNTIARHTVELAEHLHPGRNLIAVHAIDTVGGCRWLMASGSISFLE